MAPMIANAQGNPLWTSMITEVNEVIRCRKNQEEKKK